MKLRLWPDTLLGRLVLVLSVGMFAGQLLTSTIWFETSRYRSLEIPAYLLASRLSDSVHLLEQVHGDGARQELARRLSSEAYRLRWIEAPAGAPGRGDVAQRALEDILASVIRQRTGKALEVRLLDARLNTRIDVPAGALHHFDSAMPSSTFRLRLRMADDYWVDVDATEAAVATQPASQVFDYLVNVYLIRFAAVFLFALIAVRFALKPLKQMTNAAAALSQDMHRPPLPVSGPREVRDAARTFNAMQQRLVDIIGQRTRLLGAVSHDLRSPLTRLRLRAEMLADAPARERLRQDLDEMEAMVSTTLDLVRSVDIAEARHDIDMDSMLRGLRDDAMEAMEAIEANGALIEVTGRAHAPVPGYPRHLKRCLQNLVDNAARHGRHVVIGVEDEDRMLRITVSDDGPGIPDEMLGQVFEPYVRLDSTAGGTGLGLTIARAIAVAHGGTLALRNRAPRGLDAVLCLPRPA
ncbi:ATP-binding protein [Cupriavidus sp. 30B13]|uniref:ATP-binding protein n=1 Tax=Cupriavidus sp. 30B13 TaxID=3384241 RepID=UPI003B8FF19F